MPLPSVSRAAILAPIAVVLTLSGCGGSDGGPSFAGAIDTASTRSYASDGRAMMIATLLGVFGAQGVSTPTPFLAQGPEGRLTPTGVGRAYLAHLSSMAPLLTGTSDPRGAALLGRAGPVAFVAMTCVPTQSGVDSLGVPLDGDGDGIPDDYRVDFGTACSESAGGLVYTYSGSYRVQDTGVGFGSYTFTSDKFSAKIVDGSTGDYIKRTVTGTETVGFTATSAAHAMNVTIVVVAKFGSDVSDASLTVAETSSYNPDNGLTFTVGGALPTGHLTFGADYREVANYSGGVNVHFVLSTPTQLRFQAGCAAALNGGSLRGLLNGKEGTGFTYTWYSCADPGFVMFGTTDGP